MTQFEQQLKDNPIEIYLSVDGDYHLFTSNGELAGDQEEPEFQEIWMYSEDDGEPVIWAKVDIEIETLNVMNHKVTENNTKQTQLPYNLI